MTDADADRLRWVAFDRLRAGKPVTIDTIARDLEADPAAVGSAVDELLVRGLVELDDHKAMIGAHGITLTPTTHALVLDGDRLHTWCALDAVGIPAALAVDATITTACEWCASPITVTMVERVPTGDTGVVLWLPTGPCDNMRRDFCPAANLFCNPRHLDAWRDLTGKPPGNVLSLDETAALGRQAWNRDDDCTDTWPNG